MIKRQSSLVIHHPITLLVVLVILYSTVNFWTESATGLIYYVFNKDKEPSWKWKGVYAIVFTILLYFILQQINYPIVALQHGQIKGLFV
jgi:hypothetical protein